MQDKGKGVVNDDCVVNNESDLDGYIDNYCDLNIGGNIDNDNENVHGKDDVDGVSDETCLD